MGLAPVLSLFGPAGTVGDPASPAPRGSQPQDRPRHSALRSHHRSPEQPWQRPVLAISDVDPALTFHFSSSISLTKSRFSS